MINYLQQNKKKFDTARFACYLMGMNKSEILAEIAKLHEALKSSADLTPGDRIAIRNEIGDLQDRVALLEFRNENADIDYGYHSQWE